MNISTTRQPKLQISALRVCPVCLTTSGAIQKTDPCSEGLLIRLPVNKSDKVINQDEHGVDKIH